MIRRILAVVLSIFIVAPAGAFAQSSRAGVVTTLEGNVSARRVALPGPVPLKFKDDVFLQDTVTTGEKSLARMLLGGKAVVTVRERSVLTITEVPGRSTIELDSGKFALAVAREKMRPGEEIQIRTPNAIAGVRGTVVITEVNRQSAQAGGGAAAVLTNFYVLRGTITAQPLDPSTRQPTGTPLSVGAMQAYSGAGTAPPRVTPVPPEQVAQITAGLSPSGPKGGTDVGRDQVKAQQLQTAVGLLATLTGTELQKAAILAPSTSVTTSPETPTAPPVNAFDATGQELLLALDGVLNQFQEFFGFLALNAPAMTFGSSYSSGSPSSLFVLKNAALVQVGEGLDFIRLDSGASVSLAGPLLTLVDSLLITSGSLFEMNGGSFTTTGTGAVFDLDPSFVSGGDALIALNGGTFSLAGPLFTDVGGVVLSSGPLLRMQGGASLVGTGGSPLLQLTGTTIGTSGAVAMTNASMSLAGPLASATSVTGAGGTGALFALDASTISSSGSGALIQLSSLTGDLDDNFLRLINGSAINLAGSLLTFTDTSFTASNPLRSFIAVVDGSRIATTGTNDPLLSFTGSSAGATNVTSARNFFALAFNTTTTSPFMTLSGPFLSASNTTFTTGDPASNTFTFVFIGDGAQVASTSTSPFMTFTNSSLDTAGDVLTVRRSTAAASSRLTLAGPLLVATNSSFNHTSLGFGSAFSTSPSACCSAFFIGQGGQLTSTSPQALIQLTGSSFVGVDAQSGGNFFHVADTFGGAPAGELVAGSLVSLAGPLLQTTNSTITALFNLIRVQRSALNSSSTSALVDITGGSVSLGGTNAVTGGAGLGNLLNLIGSDASGVATAAASMTLAGPLARLTNTTFSSGAANVTTIQNGGIYTSSGPGAMLQLSGTTLSGFNLLSVSGLGGASGAVPATVSLAGPALASASSTITLGRNVIFNNGSLTGTGNGALVQLTGGSLTAGTSTTDGSVLQIAGTSPGLVTLAGGVLTTSGGANLTSAGALLSTFTGGRLVTPSSDPLYAFAGGTHSFGTASGNDRNAAFILNGLSSETAVESIEVETCPDGCFTSTVSRTLGTRQPVTHAGTLLDATGGTYTTNKLVRLDTALLAATAPILALKSGASMTVSNDGIDLINQAKLSISTVANPLVRLDGSTLTVSNGSLFAVRSNSFLNVAGNAIHLQGGATLNVNNGSLLFANGGSIVKIAGALVSFGTGGGTVNTSGPNYNCPSSCANINSLIVSVGNGASFSSFSIGSGAVNGGTLPTPGNGSAHVRIEGAGTVVNIAPGGN